MRPLIVYDPRIDEVLFLNSRSKGQRCNYLCFTTGEHQELEELEGEQRGLLSRLLGQPVAFAELIAGVSPTRKTRKPEKLLGRPYPRPRLRCCAASMSSSC